MRGDSAWTGDGGFSDEYFRYYDLDLGQQTFMLAHASQTLACQLFMPRVAPSGSAVVVHGYYDHVGLYGHLIRYLLGRGLAVFGYDQQGHGLSTGTPATIGDFDDYVDALAACLDAVADRLPQPWHLIGQSMGASVIMEYFYRPATLPIGKAVLLAPLVRPTRWSVNRFAYYLARAFRVGQVGRGFPRNTEDPEFRELISKDPLQARVLPVRWVRAMVRWMSRFETYPRLPVRPLVVQGGRDGTVDADYSLAVINRLFDCDVLEIPEARHHLVNETQAIREQIWRFLDARI